MQTSSFKIVKKQDANEYRVVQATNKGFVEYKINNKVGVTANESNYGGDHELLRLVGARYCPKAYVWFDVATPVTGTLTTRYEPGVYGTIESVMYPFLSYSTSDTYASTGQNGLGCYILASGQSVTYHVPASTNGKYNILFMARSDASSDVSIKIGGQEVKKFNSKITPTTGNSIGLVVFDTMHTDQSITLAITVTNNDPSNGFNLCAINFFELKDYSRQAINSFKVFVGSRSWITTSGSSDYALADENGKYFGSYHGGEISEDCKVRWCNELFERLESLNTFQADTAVGSGKWTVVKQFEIEQRTDLIGRAKMRSVFSFDTDGTMDMRFSLYQSDIALMILFTALTGTDASFDYISGPEFRYLGNQPTNQRIYLSLQNGFVSQMSSTNALQLDIRFTKFNDKNNPRGAYVLDSSVYRKFYYGPVFETPSAVPVESISFEKGLDFIVR